MRVEYRVGALLGSIVVAVAAWYFFGRESEPDIRLTADQGTVEPFIPPDDPDTQIEMAAPITTVDSSVLTIASDPAPFVTEPLQTADARNEAPAGIEAERPDSANTARVVRANTGAVLPAIDLTRVATASSTPGGSNAETTRTVELELNRRAASRGARPSEGTTAASTAIARGTPSPTADLRTPTLLGASRPPAAANPSSVRSPTPRRERATPRLTTPVATTVEAATEYVIQKNDTLAILAELHYFSQSHVTALLKANPQILNRHRIYVGQMIMIPARSTVIGQTGAVTTEVVKPTTARPAPAVPGDMYRIRRGDTLYGLAAKTYASGAKWRALLELNRDLVSGDGETLKTGQLIRLPAQLPESRRASR